MLAESIYQKKPDAIKKLIKYSAGVKDEQTTKSGTVYRQSGNLLIIRRVGQTVAFGGGDLSQRNCVVGFSPSSACRMRRYLRECTAEYRNFITLTYPCGYSSDGREAKEHLRKFLQELKRYQTRNAPDIHRYSSFWFLEFQERGAPHFHIFTTHDIPHQWISKRWYEIVGSEDVRHLNAGTSIEAFRSGRHGISSYASKYAAKQQQKDVPDNYINVGRFWGVSGRKTVESATLLITADDLQSASVQRRKKDIDNYVSSAIQEDRARVLVRKDGAAVVFIQGVQSVSIIKQKIYLAEALVSSRRQVFEYPGYDSADHVMDMEEHTS